MDFSKLRPFQIVFLIVFGLLALIGLVVFATSGVGGNSSKIGSVTIWGTLPSDAINKELASLTTADKSYGKVTYVQEPANSFDNDLADAIASGNGPDMIIINQEQLLGEQNKINVIPFSTVPQRTFIDTYLPEDQLYLTSTGTYGIPFVLDPLVLYYNQTLLSQAGIATPPSSWEAVTGLAPALTHSNSTGLTQSAIAFGTYGNIENARAILSLLFLQAGSTITQASTVSVRSVLSESQNGTLTGVSPVAAALNFYTQFADPSRTVYSWNGSISSAQQAFLANTLALYVGYASEEPEIKAANPNLSYDMASIPQPQTSPVKIDYGLAYAFALPKASRNPAGAIMVAQAMTSPSYLLPVAQSLSMAPANRTILTPSANDLYSPVYYPEALWSSGWLSPPPAITDSIFGAMINTIASGQSTATNAVNTTDQALDAALSPS